MVVPVCTILRKMFQCSACGTGNSEWALLQNNSDQYEFPKGSADLRISPVFRGEKSISCGISVKTIMDGWYCPDKNFKNLWLVLCKMCNLVLNKLI